jgi:hypothetical protein
VDSIYSGDPRVEFIDDACVVIPDTNGAGQPDNWFVLHSVFDGLWHVSSQSLCGHPNTEPDGMQTRDDAIRAVLGDPMWLVEARLIAGAGHNHGVLELGHLDEPGADEASDNLIAAEVFRIHQPPGWTNDYLVLTPAGAELACLLADRTDKETKEILDNNRPQPQ